MTINYKKFEYADVQFIDGDRGVNYPSKADFTKSGYCLFLNTGNVTSDGFDFSNLDFISKERDELLRKGKVDVYDIVLTTRGTVGNAAYVSDNIPYKHIRINSGMVIVRADQNKIDPYFLYSFFRSPLFKKQCLSNGSGSAQPQLPISALKNIVFPDFNLVTQQKIANILSTLDRKIALNQQINQKLEAMAKQLYDYWFVQFDFPDENGKPYKSSGGEMVWCEVWKRDVPKGWRTANLAELIELKTGKEDANFSSENGQYPFFTCSEQVSKCAQYAFDERTILLAGNGSFSVKKFQGKFNAYQRTYLITPFDEKLYMPIYFVVKDSIRNFISGSRGSIIKFITKGDIENLKITIPLNGNLGFAKILLVFFEKQQLLDSETQKLTQLRDVLLPMLMNGQIFVE
ncbi:restriction endonuclease subunit S [Rodentibacter pneumotropicus]|uniref:restriction endonuclease subunit S n=1 Tax=Rodentibacter pneumotropicus TaxID=758 RepID=UPI00036DDB9D|nr:restriction endonuclease subunit S [Rodentibacter pneumotropicus]MDC2824544.1 restriction endonuclease subunit S [Rodentibacter pneumotropicus]NBH75075.1 restriction endonuclease subunit S [Rodentibacter pneumotropicus]OOF61724.1 hypothetical protein BH925_02010 [Rodentibacter pneumotropicus]THA04514.1 restriction endonuclease subunit S [Rodentibacter pneumotropicus]THA05605.1 restriction endonuclease subunit S [Rodentibacter pneumotropicus]